MPEKIEPQLDEIRRRARRRLVGAVVLALAAAVLVPMLLESDPKPLGEDVSVKIPPVDEGKFVSKLGEKNRSADASPPSPIKPAPLAKPAETAPPAKDVPTAKAPSTDPASAPQAPPVKPTVVPPLLSPAPKEAAAPTETQPAPSQPTSSPPPSAPNKPAPPPASTPPASSPSEASKPSKPASGAFSVQLAAFSDDKGANALVNRLKKSGHSAYTEPYASSRGTVWRVRVGPFSSREAAEGARNRLKADGQDGIIATSN